MTTLELVVSGGQTGVDQVGLEVARALGYKTGGVAPKGWRTDEGPMEALLRDYGLVEGGSYQSRTRHNVEWADLTVWFGHVQTPGGICTMNACAQYKRLCLLNPDVATLVRAIEELQAEILNVAGNRRRTHPMASELARQTLTLALA